MPAWRGCGQGARSDLISPALTPILPRRRARPSTHPPGASGSRSRSLPGACRASRGSRGVGPSGQAQPRSWPTRCLSAGTMRQSRFPAGRPSQSGRATRGPAASLAGLSRLPADRGQVPAGHVSKFHPGWGSASAHSGRGAEIIGSSVQPERLQEQLKASRPVDGS